MINLSYTKLESATKFIEVEVCNQKSINKFVKEVGDANIYNKDKSCHISWFKIRIKHCCCYN